MTTNGEIISRFSMRWGGAAGDGLQSTGNLLQRYLNRLGYYVQGFPGTQSTIRGGHVWQHVEFSSDQILSFDRPLDLLVAFNTQSLEVHLRDVKDTGILLYDSEKVDLASYQKDLESRGIRQVAVPLTSISREVDLQTPILVNTIAVGCLISILNFDPEPYIQTLTKRFQSRERILELNIQALERGLDFIHDLQFQPLKIAEPQLTPMRRFVISGNEMIALGAVASGLKFLAQYPITPASSILTYISNRAEKFGVVVRQAEDELAAINMIIGAAYTGVRAMTASSGPGLSLMGESFGYASMTETPIVVVNSMRGGPSTGIPTKMEQSDLRSMIHLSHGEGPRVILAPRNIQEAFDITVRAFNLADIYQVPVIILSDFSLSERTENLEPLDFDVEIDRGKIWTGPTEEFPVFKRYQQTVDGIAPRAFPSTEGANYILVGAEHDEESHSLSGNRCGLPSSWEIREIMVARRLKKTETLRNEMRGPDHFGPESADITILCWGSIEGAVIEAMEILNTEAELQFDLYSFADLFPLPYEKIIPILDQINTSIMIEVNTTGQFESLIHEHTGWRPDYRIHPVDGETPTPSQLTGWIRKVLEAK